jgi:hypothetical protein
MRDTSTVNVHQRFYRESEFPHKNKKGHTKASYSFFLAIYLSLTYGLGFSKAWPAELYQRLRSLKHCGVWKGYF